MSSNDEEGTGGGSAGGNDMIAPNNDSVEFDEVSTNDDPPQLANANDAVHEPITADDGSSNREANRDAAGKDTTDAGDDSDDNDENGDADAGDDGDDDAGDSGNDSGDDDDNDNDAGSDAISAGSGNGDRRGAAGDEEADDWESAKLARKIRKKRKKERKEKKKRRKRNREAEADDEEEVEDESDNAAGKKSKKKHMSQISKRVKTLASRMFSDEADVAEDDDEEEEEEYEQLPPEERIVDHDEQAAIEAVERRHKDNREYISRSAEEIAEEIERRHKVEERLKQRYGTQDGFAAQREGDAVGQQSLLPSVMDPKIFKLKCKPGQEQLIVRSLMLKALDVRRRTGQLKIKSAFCSSAKGFIYVEAVSEAFAKELIQGLRSIYVTSFSQVPVSEMTSVLVATVKKKPIRVGQFVRLKRGPLKGDLARVLSLHEGGSKAFIQAIPRPDYTYDAEQEKANKRANAGAAGSGAAMKVRPPQRLFDPEEARAAKSAFIYRRTHHLDPSTTHYDFWNGDYFKHGFLYKEVNVATYLDDSNDIKPRLDELQMFRQQRRASSRTHDDAQGSDNEEQEGGDNADDDIHNNDPNSTFMKDLAEQIQSLGEDEEKEGPTPFLPGDLVQVTSGEMRNLVARVTMVNDATRIARIVPYENKDLNTEMDIEMDLLVKHIFPGAHVKVVSGRYMGQTGRVVSVEMKDGQNVASILTDGINSELQCNVKHLQMSSEVTTGHGDLLGFELYDLVALSENECAVVILVGAEQLRVINHMGIVKDVSPMELRGKRNAFSRRSHGFDKQQNAIAVGDMVKVLTGPKAKMSGTIKHMMKGTLWLHSNSYLKDSGVFACRNRDCMLAGGTQPTPVMSANYKGVLLPTPAHAVGSDSLSATPAVPGRPPRGGRDETVGMTVKITKGAYKGMLAQVVDATPTHFSLELLARMKKIVLERSKAIPVGDAGGSLHHRDDMQRQQAAQIADGSAIPSTPFLSMPTPMAFNGSETPRYAIGSETPMNFGDATPSRTPGREEADALWQVNEEDLAVRAADSSGFSVSSSMQNTPGSLYSRNNTSLPPSRWEESTGTGASAYQSTGNNYSSAYSNNYSGNFSATGETPMSTGYGTVSSNVAELGSVHSGTSGMQSHMTGTSAGTGGPSHGTDQSGSSNAVSHLEWTRGMVVQILNGEDRGRYAVIEDTMKPNGLFHVSVREGSGGRLGRGMDIHYSELKLAEVVRKDRAVVLSGRRKGAQGIVKTVQRRDVWLAVDGSSGAPELFRSYNLACLHVDSR